MTEAELEIEWQYRFDERMGMLTQGTPSDDHKFTEEQMLAWKKLAWKDADGIVRF